MSKSILLFLALVSIFSFSTRGQAPNSFSYQSVVRDASGNLLTNQAVGLRFEIQQGSIGGTVVYTETFSLSTNQFGLVNLKIGTGTTSDDFSIIDWANGPYFLETSVDVSGGTSYLAMGTQQLASVPYALHAKTAGSVSVDEISDADGDTKVRVEETADEDVIRFDVGGTEYFSIGGSTLETANNNGSVFIGASAGQDNLISPSSSVAIGDDALTNGSSVSNNNTAIGGAAMSGASGQNNTAIGKSSMTNSSGNGNTAVGASTLGSNTGYSNVAVGVGALDGNGSGYQNVAIGSTPMASNTSGNNNVAIGTNALPNNTGGTGNIAIGENAMDQSVLGHDNIAIGTDANAGGEPIAPFPTQHNVAIGSNASTTFNSAWGVALGYNAATTDNQQIRIGSVTANSIGGYANWTNVSDGRFKLNVQEDVSGLDFIMKLRPVTYNIDVEELVKFIGTDQAYRLPEIEALKATQTQTGFIAQEVEAAAKDLGYEFSGVDAPRNDQSHYGLRYAEFVVPLVKGMQEQQAIIEQQQKEIEELKILTKKLLER